MIMRSRLKWFIAGVALMAGVFLAPAQITNLGIAAVGGGQSLLSWPAVPTNYVLLTIPSLTSTSWATARTAFGLNSAVVTNAAPAGFYRLQLVTVPAGMALVPAGWFIMGDPLNNESDAQPTHIYVSAFVMDVNLVSYGMWTNLCTYARSHGYNLRRSLRGLRPV